ncbi:MAG: hypothetical protein FWC27_15635 [Firmicutes bacterium]|nr:hypothetical protein [Bacillota bacterium]
MADEKRTVNGFEVQFAMHVGPREVVFLLDPASAETPYMVGYCDIMPGLGTEQLFEVLGSDDYLEMVDEFIYRARIQVDLARTERDKLPGPREAFGAAQCLSDGMKHSLEGKVVILRPETLRPEYRNAANQLIYVTGGFGASPDGHGTAVFGKYVFSGENRDCRRHQILGVLDPDKAPEWVRPGVCEIIAQKKEKGGKPHER